MRKLDFAMAKAGAAKVELPLVSLKSIAHGVQRIAGGALDVKK